MAIALCVIAVPAMAEERLSLSNVDLQTVITFKATDAAVQKMLPPGWEVNSPTAGPSQGFNLGLTLINQLFAQDADGQPTAWASGALLTIPANKAGSNVGGAMVVAGLFSPNGTPGAYGLYQPARVVVERRARIRSDWTTGVYELWELKADDGGSIDIQLRYSPALASKAKVEAKVFSAARPEFYRIYRIEQATDVVRSTATGVDRIGKLTISTSGRKLAELFDGAERVISVTSIPWYSRQVYLP